MLINVKGGGRNTGVEKVLDIPLSDDEKENLIASVKTLKNVIADLDI